MSGGWDDQLLQIKRQMSSVLEPYFWNSAYGSWGRIVQGQRLMQEASGIFLGWTHGVADHHVRQLRDMKLSEDNTNLTKREGINYQLCFSAPATHAAETSPDQRLPGQ
jgi:hypothetical protein